MRARRLHALHLRAVDEVGGLGCEGNMHRQKVTLGNQRIHIYQAHATLGGVFGGDIGIIGDHIHAQALGAAYDFLGDASEANRAKDFIAYFNPHKLIAIPLPGAHMSVGLGDVTRQGREAWRWYALLRPRHCLSGH